MSKQLGKVAVLFGGKSGEREVSLKSGTAVLASLQRQGVDAHAFDPAVTSLHELAAYDRVFIALHGQYGEDGTIQGALELMGIPYTGSGVMASSVGMDKWRTKLLWRSVGLPTPDFELVEADSDFTAIEQRLGLPLFVKPANEGSSIGISKVKQAGNLQAAYTLAAQSDPLVLAERFIGGGEYTVGILDGVALPAIRIVPANEFYDYEAKYLRDDTRYLCPCGLPAEQEAAIRAQALQAFRIVGGRGWGRVDFLMDDDGQHYFLEVNTSPGMTDHSLVPMAARAAGLDFDALVLRILELAHVDKPQALNWIANLLYALALVLMLYGAIYVVVHLPIFPLRQVRIDGELTHVTREQVRLIVARHLGGNFFTLDLVKTREAFEKLPWARNVSLRRRWPDRLEVTIEEHKELARWGNIAMVNSYGEFFHAASDSDLPVFYGPGDGAREVAEYYAKYSQILAPVGLKVAQLVLTPRRAWEIKTEEDLVIELGRDDMETRLRKFASVYTQTLGQPGVKVAYADLRYPNGFAVRRPVKLPLPRKAGAA